MGFTLTDPNIPEDPASTHPDRLAVGSRSSWLAGETDPFAILPHFNPIHTQVRLPGIWSSLNPGGRSLLYMSMLSSLTSCLRRL